MSALSKSLRPHVHFFDIKSSLPVPRQSFSPNTLRTRLSLNYKRIPYTESLISYPDIERLWKSLHIPPSGAGQPQCTLPVVLVREDDTMSGYSPATRPLLGEHIHSRRTPTRHLGPVTPIATTLAIARALDELYPPPQNPALFPFRHSQEHTDQVQALIKRLLPFARRLIIPSVPHILDERGREYFFKTRREWFRVNNLNDLRPKSQIESEELWCELEKEITPVIELLQANGGPFVEGKVPSYPDFVMVAFLAWWLRVDRQAYERLVTLGGGALKILWDGCLPWLEGRGEELEWDVETVERA